MSNRTNISAYVLAIFVIGITLKIYFESDTFNLKCIVSKIDGNKYCVREREKLELAVREGGTGMQFIGGSQIRLIYRIN